MTQASSMKKDQNDHINEGPKASNDKGSNEFQPPDPVAFGKALLQAYEKAQPLFEEYCNKMGTSSYIENLYKQDLDPMNIRQSYLEFFDKLAADPSKVFSLQAGFMQDWVHLWQESALKFMGQDGKTLFEPDKGDRRFKNDAWQENALFDFIKQSYLLTCRWMDKTVHDVEGLTPEQREKLAFQTRLLAGALSPTNYMLTNPEVLEETARTGGENLVRGLENLMADLERGKGQLKISTTDYTAFKLGENIATTPGRVVYQNDLMQLLQYEPVSKTCFQTPLLIVPPWINKYYILDLKAENSFVRWATEQGHTVYMISWVNPGPELAQKRFEDYMSEGVLDAITQIKQITGEEQVNAVGYCLGGTLLAVTLAYLAVAEKHNAPRIKSATFLTTLLDFEMAGDLKLFLDKGQIEALDKLMQKNGVLPGAEMQKTFNLLRANDLIWSFVVNNYLMGKEPFPFDLLYWNDDCTNMPSAMHRFYLKNMYVDNVLKDPGGVTMKGVPIDLRKISVPTYFLSTREDHIAPWMATYKGAKLFNGPCTFTLAASGHVAGVVNHPDKNKYCYWVADQNPENAENWMDGAAQHEGSWWTHWQSWLAPQSGADISARKPTEGIEPAPGSYVKKRW